MSLPYIVKIDSSQQRAERKGVTLKLDDLKDEEEGKEVKESRDGREARGNSRTHLMKFGLQLEAEKIQKFKSGSFYVEEKPSSEEFDQKQEENKIVFIGLDFLKNAFLIERSIRKERT